MFLTAYSLRSMNIWTKDNNINYNYDPDEAYDKKNPKEL